MQVLGDIEVETFELARVDAGGPDPDAPPVVRECELGQMRCDGTFVETCVSAGAGAPPRWLSRACAPQGTCALSPTARCVTQACSVDEIGCLGATPRVCNADQTAWETLDACLSAAHCTANPADCPERQAPCCLEAPCQAGEVRCNGTLMERCRSNRTGWEQVDECPTAELCADGLESCGGRGNTCGCERQTCAPGARRCTDDLLEMCLPTLTGWEPLSRCATPALCRSSLDGPSGRCTAPVCAAGELRCTPQGVLEVCRGDLTGFETRQVCEGAPFCNVVAGRCEASACEAGATRCNGAQIQVCNDDRTAFENLGQPCATAALCDDDGSGTPFCRTPACGVGQFRCLAIGQPQRCNAGRTGFDNVGFQCARSDLCSEARQRCDNCVPGRQECTGDNRGRRTCNLDGNGFGPTTDCPLGCAPVTGQCQT
jgi:hypothetical protein